MASVERPGGPPGGGSGDPAAIPAAGSDSGPVPVKRRARTAKDEAPAGIYGTIICASVMAAGSHYPVGEVAGTVIITLLVYWAAERWSEVMGGTLKGERADWPHVRAVFGAGWPMVQASYTPLVIMGAAWLLGAEDDTAITIALWATIGLLAFLGSVAGRRGGLRGWSVVWAALFTGFLGAVLVGLKALLH